MLSPTKGSGLELARRPTAPWHALRHDLLHPGDAEAADDQQGLFVWIPRASIWPLAGQAYCGVGRAYRTLPRFKWRNAHGRRH